MFPHAKRAEFFFLIKKLVVNSKRLEADAGKQTGLKKTEVLQFNIFWVIYERGEIFSLALSKLSQASGNVFLPAML